MGWLSYPLRYYSGTAHAGEYVSLVREPNNPYDRNAIRVDNMHGQKVWPGNEGKTMESGMIHPWDLNIKINKHLDENHIRNSMCRNIRTETACYVSYIA